MKNGLIAYFVGNPVAAKLLMIFLILGGILAGLNLHVRQIPDLDFRTISVTVASPGSSPREIEEDINRRIEESVLGLEGVDRVVSAASEGYARIEVEIETFADADAVLAAVKNAVDSIENFPPASARPPKIALKKLSVEVLTISVSSSTLSEHDLRLAAENLRDDLLALPSVSLVPTQRYARPGNLHRNGRGGVAPKRPDHLRGGAQGAQGLAQPDIRRIAYRTPAAWSST